MDKKASQPKRNLRGSYSSGEIELTGSSSSLLAFASFLAGDTQTLWLFHPDKDRALPLAQVVKLYSTEPLAFAPEAGILTIRGRPADMSIIAESIQSLALHDNLAGHHIHFTPGASPIIDPTCMWEFVVTIE